MPKTALIQTNMTGGELSPYLYGRVDVAKYSNGTAVMQDFHPIIQGGAVSRPGSRYLGTALGDGRLVPFVFSRGVAYQLEFTAGKLRIWNANGDLVQYAAVTIEITTPYTFAQLWEMTYEQAEDTMFLFHESIAPQRLQRRSETSWVLETAPFITTPFAEGGYAGVATPIVTMSAATVGTGRTLTAAAALWLAGDIGREFRDSFGGRSTITAVSSSTVATADVTAAFSNPVVTNWTLTDSPQAFLYPTAKDPIGATTTLLAAPPRAASITLTAKTGAITIDSSPAIFVAGDTGKVLYADIGTVTLTFVSATQCTGTTSTDFLRLTYGAGAWGITGDAFRTVDVGAFVNVNGGLFQITAFNNATSVAAEIRVSPSALLASPPGAWSISQSAFSATLGYPRCGALHEQRLWLAGTTYAPQTLWASRIGEYLDFESGLSDADGFSYKLNSKQRNQILHLAVGKRLFALTTGLEASLRGGNEKAIGPTNIQKENESSYGTSQVRPVAIGKEIVYVQGAGRKVRALGYSAAIDGFDSPDRTVFAQHVSDSSIREIAYQPEEHSLLYAVRNDGQMAVAAYDVGQEVIAWSRFTTTGYYRSVSVIPNAASDDVWTLVNRPDAAALPRYFVERFQPELATDSAGYLNTADLGPPGYPTLTGLTRFNGQSVAVRADDAYQGILPVTGGQITLTRNSTSYIEAGLPFVPTLELLPPDAGGGGGTIQGSNVSVHEVSVRLLDTKDLEINGMLSDFRRFGTSLLDQPPPGYTGDYRVIKLTDNFIRDKLVIRQPLPFKCHVQAVVRKVTVNDV